MPELPSLLLLTAGTFMLPIAIATNNTSTSILSVAAMLIGLAWAWGRS